METTKTCPQCSKPLPVGAPEGLCPQCLVKVGIGSGFAEAGTPTVKGPPPPLAIDNIARHFPQLEILEQLGQGGMGVVYKARQRELDRLVALKVLPPDIGADASFVERFQREARALARLNHPNIVAVYDFGQTNGLCYFIMEFVDGANLRQLQRAKNLTPQEALGIVPKICEALQFAHDEGIVHRDIKPENILMDKKGRVKIADFGLAKLLGKSAPDFALTGPQTVMGTPHYMAPEQIQGTRDVDHRADIYSLGVVFYEMLTGELPLGRFAPPSHKVQMDVRLDEIVLKTLEQEPGRRYQHASEVKTQVENISGMVASLPPQLRHAFGFEYKSKTEWFGLPLVHIVSGMDLATGKARVARGILAIGGVAKGVVAFGGVAYGFIAFGGLAVGGFVFAGCGAGLVSVAGLAVALALAYGGLAVAPIAMGGVALGYYALGGAAFGAHAAGGNAGDPAARQFFASLMTNWKYVNIAGLALMAVSFLVPFVGTALAKRKLGEQNTNPTPPRGQPPHIGGAAPARPEFRKNWRVIGTVAGLVMLLVFAVLFRKTGSPGLTSHLVPEITKDLSKLPATTTPGRRDFAFTFNAPSNHVLNVWLEFWKDGKVEIPTSFSQSYWPARGDSVRAGLHLITQDGDVASLGSAGQMRFDWAMDRQIRIVSARGNLHNTATSSSGQWRTNLFNEIAARGGGGFHLSWDNPPGETRWHPKPGEAATVLVWAGYATNNFSFNDAKWSEESLQKGWPTVAVLLRARFDPVTSGQLSEAPVLKTGTVDKTTRGPVPASSAASQ